MMRFTSIAVLMTFLCGLLNWQVAAAEPATVEKTELAATSTSYFRHDEQRKGQELFAVDVEGGSHAVVQFNASILKQAGAIELKQATLHLGIQYLREVSRDNPQQPVVELYHLLRPVQPVGEDTTLKLQSGVDYTATPDVSFPLPGDAAVKQMLSIPVNIPAGADVVDWINNGWLVKLRAPGLTRILQVNFFGAKPSSGNGRFAPGLTVEFTSPLAKLDLRPVQQIQAGKFVTARDGDLYYDGKPIHLYGINFSANECASYEAVDHLVHRLRDMNINSIRLWAGPGRIFYTPESTAQKKMIESKQGDGSDADRYDYLIYRLQEAGIFIHNTTLGSHGPELQYWPGLDFVLERAPGGGYDPLYYNAFPIMGYLDQTVLDMQIAHIRMYLDRVNPYTKQRYAEMPVFATWELANENHTVAALLEGRTRKWPEIFQKKLTQRWNQWLTQRYHDDAGLLQAWGALNPGESLKDATVAAAPIASELAQFPAARGRDYVRFAQDVFISASREMEKAARSMAPEGVGVNIAPIVDNTHADLSMNAQYASGAGSAVSVGLYQTPYTTDTSFPHYPWRPISTERPFFYNFNFQTLRNKPFIVYEHSFFRPYPYRAEWNPAIALLGAGLGWDSIYLYAFGQPWAVSDQQFSDISFGTKPLPMPRDTSHNGYTTGFHHGGDEVAMSTLALTGQAFINGIKPNREVTTVTFGPSAYEDPAYRHYSPSGPAQAVPDRPMAGGETEWYSMPNLYRRFMETSIRSRLQLDFDPQQTVPIRISGNLVDSESVDAKETLTPSDDITWDPRNQRIILDTPTSKLVVGFIKDGYTFKDGIQLGALNRDFAFFGIASRDGKPIAESSDLVMALCSQSANTGYELDPQKIHGSTLGMINGIVNRGTAPVVVDRVGATIALPGVKGTLTCYNFAMYGYRQAAVDGQVQIQNDEPLYLARIRR